MPNQHDYVLILAGGGGTRLWPMSRKNLPKQLVPLIDERTMFKTSVDRLNPLFPPERIYIVTGKDYAAALKAEASHIPPENFIIEPYGKDSAPAAALAIGIIHKRDPLATVALLTADHHIAKVDEFLGVLRAAYQIANDRHIVTLGISPTYPATGFGYIRQGEEITKVRGHNCYHAVKFTEKPDAVTAAQFVTSGEYTWNSGMFIWRTEHALSEFERQQPAIRAALDELEPTIDTPQFETALNVIWEKMPRISLDFAVMEGAERMVIIPVDIGWSDVGSWDSLYEVLDPDEAGNRFKGKKSDEHIILETSNTMIYSDRLTVAIGIEDTIIIDTDDVLLICRKDHSQSVKDVVNHLRTSHKDDYL